MYRTATREGIECNRYFLAAERHELMYGALKLKVYDTELCLLCWGVLWVEPMKLRFTSKSECLILITVLCVCGWVRGGGGVEGGKMERERERRG